MRHSNHDISIREATTDDAVLISVLAIATFYEAYFEQDEPADLAAYIRESFDIDTLANEIADPATSFHIIFRNGKAVGYAKLIDGSTHPSLASQHPVELKRIYLLERVWGSGIGELLLDHCVKTAKELGGTSIWLGVWEENQRGQSFYKKHGFVQTGTLEFPYGDSVGINLVMERPL
ncbi:MAG: N-acetyltransferase [Pyrinomonadaceae bacterium]